MNYRCPSCRLRRKERYFNPVHLKAVKAECAPDRTLYPYIALNNPPIHLIGVGKYLQGTSDWRYDDQAGVKVQKNAIELVSCIISKYSPVAFISYQADDKTAQAIEDYIVATYCSGGSDGKELKCKLTRLPQEDYTPPMVRDIITTWRVIDEVRAKNNDSGIPGVLLHCNASTGRTPTMVMSYAWLQKHLNTSGGFLLNTAESISSQIANATNRIMVFLTGVVKSYSHVAYNEIFKQEKEKDLLHERIRVINSTIRAYCYSKDKILKRASRILTPEKHVTCDEKGVLLTETRNMVKKYTWDNNGVVNYSANDDKILGLVNLFELLPDSRLLLVYRRGEATTFFRILSEGSNPENEVAIENLPLLQRPALAYIIKGNEGFIVSIGEDYKLRRQLTITIGKVVPHENLGPVVMVPVAAVEGGAALADILEWRTSVNILPSPDGSYIAIMSAAHVVVCQLDLIGHFKPTYTMVLSAEIEKYKNMSWSPDSKRLLVAGKSMRLLDVVLKHVGLGMEVDEVTCSVWQSGTRVWTGTADGRIMAWDVETDEKSKTGTLKAAGDPEECLVGHESELRRLYIRENNILSVDSEGTCIKWNIEEGL